MKIDSLGSLGGGALAGIGASLCCVGPLVLVSVGVSGAWIANLTALEPYRWVFVAAAAGFMALAWRRIYRAPAAPQCAPGSACAVPRTNRLYRALFWTVSALIVASALSPYLVPLLDT